MGMILPWNLYEIRGKFLFSIMCMDILFQIDRDFPTVKWGDFDVGFTIEGTLLASAANGAIWVIFSNDVVSYANRLGGHSGQWCL